MLRLKEDLRSFGVKEESSYWTETKFWKLDKK